MSPFRCQRQCLRKTQRDPGLPERSYESLSQVTLSRVSFLRCYFRDFQARGCQPEDSLYHYAIAPTSPRAQDKFTDVSPRTHLECPRVAGVVNASVPNHAILRMSLEWRRDGSLHMDVHVQVQVRVQVRIPRSVIAARRRRACPRRAGPIPVLERRGPTDLGRGRRGDLKSGG